MAVTAQDHATVAAAPYQETGLGYVQYTGTGAAVTMKALALAAVVPYTLTGQERRALITIEVAAVRWLNDGQVPTANYGNLVPAGKSLSFPSDFSQFQVFVPVGGVVNVNFQK